MNTGSTGIVVDIPPVKSAYWATTEPYSSCRAIQGRDSTIEALRADQALYDEIEASVKRFLDGDQ
jgi:hypothetical protein